MNRKLMLLAALILASSSLWAGDTAIFVDLGFSADGKAFMFGQYGIQPGTLRPWADLHVVDVASNSYVPGGRINYVHDSAVAAGHDGSGALYRVIARNTALADRYHIGYLRQGHLLYVSLENGDETVEFRDFEKASSFRASLSASGYGQAAGSSFVISLERRGSDGSVRTYTVGNGAVKRPGIVSYRIRRVLASPHNGSLVFVVEMKKLNSDGSADIRYMVETLLF
jgi:predicted secreted protein